MLYEFIDISSEINLGMNNFRKAVTVNAKIGMVMINIEKHAEDRY